MNGSYMSASCLVTSTNTCTSIHPSIHAYTYNVHVHKKSDYIGCAVLLSLYDLACPLSSLSSLIKTYIHVCIRCTYIHVYSRHYVLLGDDHACTCILKSVIEVSLYVHTVSRTNDPIRFWEQIFDDMCPLQLPYVHAVYMQKYTCSVHAVSGCIEDLDHQIRNIIIVQ